MRRSSSAKRASRPFGLPKAGTTLLILDMLSDFRFPQGRQVLRAARRIAP